MRVVTWNMGCGPAASPYRKTHGEAWEYLLQELRPDVAFVQEAVVTKINEARHDHSVTICDLGSNAVAGTAVLVRGFEPCTVPSVTISAHTYAATTGVRTALGPLALASVHVYPGSEHHNDLNKVVALLGSTFTGQPLLVGGDFNAARRFDDVYGGTRHRAFFSAMNAAGLHEVHWGMHGREVQSFWGRQTKEVYQDDHFFITVAWSSRVRSCRVIDNDVVRRVSDHGPVEMDLDLAG